MIIDPLLFLLLHNNYLLVKLLLMLLLTIECVDVKPVRSEFKVQSSKCRGVVCKTVCVWGGGGLEGREFD